MNNKLKEKRAEKGITQCELSESANVSRTIISRMENGKLEVTTTGTLIKLAKALNTSVKELFFSN